MKDDQKKSELAAEDSENLSQVFRSQMPKLDKAEFNVEVQAWVRTVNPWLSHRMNTCVA